jgi:hypothetical protein
MANCAVGVPTHRALCHPDSLFVFGPLRGGAEGSSRESVRCWPYFFGLCGGFVARGFTCHAEAMRRRIPCALPARGTKFTRLWRALALQKIARRVSPPAALCLPSVALVKEGHPDRAQRAEGSRLESVAFCIPRSALVSPPPHQPKTPAPQSPRHPRVAGQPWAHDPSAAGRANKKGRAGARSCTALV